MRVFSWLEDRQVTGLTEKEGEKEREASEAAVSPGNAESESCGESQALGALLPLFCIPSPAMAPSLSYSAVML